MISKRYQSNLFLDVCFDDTSKLKIVKWKLQSPNDLVNKKITLNTDLYPPS